MPTVLGHPIPAPRGVPTLQHQLFGLLAHLGVAAPRPFCPNRAATPLPDRSGSAGLQGAPQLSAEVSRSLLA